MQYFTLYNGVEIPAIGMGTGIAKGLMRHPKTLCKRILKEGYQNLFVQGFKENNKYTLSMDLIMDLTLKKVSSAAAAEGCRLFDTARAYGYSESYIAKALWRNSKDKRRDYFVITKATNTAQRENRVRECFEESLRNLNTDYVDLYLLHWPQTGTWLDAWKILEELYKSGKARAIGVCNCHVHHLQELLQVAEVAPMVDELECHPLLQQNEVRSFCKENKIQLIAHTPTGKMNKTLAESTAIQEICERNHVSPSQVILRWHYQMGDVSIPNTTNVNHVKDNLQIWNFSLSSSDMEKIAELDCGYRIWPNPDHCDFTKL